VKGFKPGDKVTGVGFKRSFAEYATIDLASKELFTGVVKVPDGIPLISVSASRSNAAPPSSVTPRSSSETTPSWRGAVSWGWWSSPISRPEASGRSSRAISWRGRLKLAKEMGATATLNAGKVDVVKEVEAITGGRMCDVAFEGIGKPAGVALTSKVIRNSPPPGTIVLYGYHGWPDTYDLSLWGPKAPWCSACTRALPDQQRDLEISVQAIARGSLSFGEADLAPLLARRNRDGLGGARQSSRGVYQRDRDSVTIRKRNDHHQGTKKYAALFTQRGPVRPVSCGTNDGCTCRLPMRLSPWCLGVFVV